MDPVTLAAAKRAFNPLSQVAKKRAPVQKELLFGGESGESWTLNGHTLSATQALAGSQSLRLENSGGDPWAVINVSNVEWLNDIKLSLFVPSGEGDVSAFNFVELRFQVDGSNYYSKNLTARANEIQDEWLTWCEARSNFNETGSPSWDDVTDLYIRVRRNPGTAVVYVDECYTVTNQGGVLFQFDDAYDSAYLRGLPILEKYNISATVFAITGEVGNAGYMTWDQLRDLRSRGWLIGNHTDADSILTGISESAAQTRIETARDALRTQGLATGSTYLATPGGNTDSTVRAAAYAAGMTFIREASDEPNIPVFGQEATDFAILDYESEDNTAEATITANIDAAVSAGRVYSIVFHKIADANASLTIAESILANVVKHVYDNGYRTFTWHDVLRGLPPDA